MSIYGLSLDGWDELSTWGFDTPLGHSADGYFYAQLTRNGNSDDDGPDIWITPPDFPVIRTSEELAVVIADATSADLSAVYAAMHVGLTAP